MMELRKDYFLDRWVIVAEKRKSRPHQYYRTSTNPPEDDYFAIGNESLTPPEIGRIISEDDPDQWEMRWFENKFPAVDLSDASGAKQPKTDNCYFTFASAYGYHEIIVETPSSTEQTHNFSVEKIKRLLHVYLDRIRDLRELKHIKYVCVIKNEGEDAATSLVHSHSQVIAYNILPVVVDEKVRANKTKCHYCNVLEMEKNSDRRCYENDGAVAFAPYASRFGYEIWIMPKRHIARIDDFTDDEIGSMADLMKKALSRLVEATSSYNMAVYYAPDGADLHFHIEILPRISKFGGFEFLSGTIINPVSPEHAAEFYRG